VLKALGTGFSGMRFTDVEVARDDRGRPTAVLHGRAADTAESLGVVELHLSLSYTHMTAVASAVTILRGDATAPPAAELSATERLAVEFKQAKGMLDELPDREPDEPAATGDPRADRPGGDDRQ
jgi:holo-[acyl-carrier protein] synthase